MLRLGARNRIFAPLGLAMLLAACIKLIPGPDTPRPPPVAAATTAAEMGVMRAAAPARLAITAADASAALEAFVSSCRHATTRNDASGLTRPEDWRAPCDAARGWSGRDAREFFAAHFDSVQVGPGQAFATGYFEPEILGSRIRRPGYEVPIYRMPPDLVRSWPEATPQDQRSGQAPLGRIDASGRHVPYYTRAEIEDGALAGRGLELAWAADKVEFFFLQVQGSGRLRTPEGAVIRIGYAGQNGHPYTGIGGLMRQRGLLGSGPGQYSGSMQGIMQYIRDNPRDGAALMRENASWVFFQELTGPNAAIGPLGSLGVPVRGESSVAVDPKFVPYGAPVFLDVDRAEADGLWIAQDTGGAIRGANRFDTFWGAGTRARETAGGMSARGQAIILLPHDAAQRLLR
jgi:membrane-bound lytic murein transglycosylase A